MGQCLGRPVSRLVEYRGTVMTPNEMLFAVIKQEAGASEDVIKAIEYGAKIHCRNKEGHTPLYMAAFYNRLDITRVLLEKGAYPARSDGNVTSFDIANSRCRTSIVLEMLRYHPTLINTPTFEVSEKGPKLTPLEWANHHAYPKMFRNIKEIAKDSGIVPIHDIEYNPRLSSCGATGAAAVRGR